MENDNGVKLSSLQNLDNDSGVKYTIPGILHFIQHEWARFEMERAHWDVERAELQVLFCFLLLMYMQDATRKSHFETLARSDRPCEFLTYKSRYLFAVIGLPIAET